MSKQIYLIADAGLPSNILKDKITSAIAGGISKLQLFNAASCSEDDLKHVKNRCDDFGVQLFIHNHYELAKRIGADGAHFDELPVNSIDISGLKVGLTVGNNLKMITSAEKMGVDYISFCSVFPSKSATVCNLVRPDVVSEARNLFSGEIFLAGGISELNIPQLKGQSFDGIAVISEIMEASNIQVKIQTLKKLLS